VAGFTAYYDANVLYPSDLRNFLMHLDLTDLFRTRRSADVHEEWIEALLKTRPDLTREKLERTRSLMDEHAPDALVTGHHDLIPGLVLPDPNDRHVLAAAICGRADVIVTINLKDFPAQTIEPFGIAARHPDEFFLHLLDLAPGRVLKVAGDHRTSLKNPPKTVEEHRGTLEPQGLTQTVSLMRQIMF
jgi:predicted nucleic acid-binding protein